MLTPDIINEYASKHSSDEMPVLQALAEETRKHVPGAQMLTGHLAGGFLMMMSKILQPRVVVELGTYTGYSAICLAQGLAEGGVLHTYDIDDRWQEMRNKYWNAAGLASKIVQHIGDAVSLIEKLDVVPDLVFIDADKKSYYHYVQTCLEKMRPGGIILVDNVLFKGEVAQAPETMKNTAKYIHDFNQQILQNNQIDILLLPIRDGITMIHKK